MPAQLVQAKQRARMGGGGVGWRVGGRAYVHAHIFGEGPAGRPAGRRRGCAGLNPNPKRPPMLRDAAGGHPMHERGGRRGGTGGGTGGGGEGRGREEGRERRARGRSDEGRGRGEGARGL